MKNIAILGSTGSIGRSTLDVINSYPERFRLISIAAGSNINLALAQTVRWRPKLVSLAQESDVAPFLRHLADRDIRDVEVVSGAAGTIRVATNSEVDFVVSAIVGVAGLEATYEAVKAGKTIGLANKECMVAAGELITAEARRQNKPILPIDSEHNAVHQCMRGGSLAEVHRVWLTASGGPFRNTPESAFEHITVDEALNHPTWKMGKRITIDSATLMNKGFEVIEACRLFNIPPSQVEVIIHPQSTIHSMVEFVDGSILAQLSVTDMRLPILYAMTFPERVESDLRFRVSDLRQLDFQPPDVRKFPCLRLAYEAAEAGGAQTIALNAADEVSVAAFLDKKIGFNDIPKAIASVLKETGAGKPESIEEVLQLDVAARRTAADVIHAFSRNSGRRVSVPHL